MAQDISLQMLIEQVKDELLAPTSGPDYPVFFVDRVELELNVAISREANGGLKISVLSFGGVEAGGSTSRERGHTIKVSLSPILSREEQRQLLEEDGRLLAGVRRASQAALRKGGQAGSGRLAGEPE
jgi:hypothetical protein